MAGGGSAVRAGKAYVELYADDSKLVRGLKTAANKIHALSRRSTQTTSNHSGKRSSPPPTWKPSTKSSGAFSIACAGGSPR